MRSLVGLVTVAFVASGCVSFDFAPETVRYFLSHYGDCPANAGCDWTKDSAGAHLHLSQLHWSPLEKEELAIQVFWMEDEPLFLGMEQFSLEGFRSAIQIVRCEACEFTFQDGWAAGDRSQHSAGLEVSGDFGKSGRVQIDNFTASGFTACMDIYSVEILSVVDLHVRDCEVGIMARGIQATSISHLETYGDSALFVTQVFVPTNFTLTDSRVDGGTLHLWSAASATLQNITFVNQTGVALVSMAERLHIDSSTFVNIQGSAIQMTNRAANTTVRNSSFINVTDYGIEVRTPGAVTPVDARHNYWGSDFGPTVGNTVRPPAPLATGARVSGDVQFVPWKPRL